MSAVKTEVQLKKEWGQERFVKALGIVSGWMLDKQHPVTGEQLEELKDNSLDALTLFASRTYHKSAA